MTEKLDLDRLQALAEAATPGPWTRGDRWHIQGASHCECRPQHGPLVEERRMDINGEMMLAHVHEMPQPWWDHGIYTRERQEDGFAWNIVNDTYREGEAVDLKPCATCGALLTPALADAVNSSSAPETCPRRS